MGLSNELVRGRDPVLDGLRGVSIALVILHHARAGLGLEELPLLPFAGVTGVALFFVISGYLITNLLLDEKEATGRISLRNFYGRRALRIFPAFYCFLAVMVVGRGVGLVTFSNIELLASATYWRNVYPGGGSVLQHTWSLAVEEQFYLAWPLVLARVRPQGAVIVAAAIILGQPLVRWIARGVLYYEDGATALNGAGLETILVGSLLAIGLRNRAVTAPLMTAFSGRGRPALILAAICLLYWGAGHTRGPASLALPYLRSVLLVALLFSVLCRRNDPVSRALAWRPISAAGLISYSLYLWQQPFLVEVPHHGGQPLVGIVFAVFAALTSFFLIERPALSLRHYFSPRRETAGVTSPSSAAPS